MMLRWNPPRMPAGWSRLSPFQAGYIATALSQAAFPNLSDQPDEPYGPYLFSSPEDRAALEAPYAPLSMIDRATLMRMLDDCARFIAKFTRPGMSPTQRFRAGGRFFNERNYEDLARRIGAFFLVYDEDADRFYGEWSADE